MPIRKMKYNPAFLTEGELVESFVVRHDDLETILQVIRENTGAVNQHVLVIGPRGSGKTTLALRTVAEIRRSEALSTLWYPIVFGEESYQVTSPGEFWLEAIFHLAHQTKDGRWEKTHEELRAEPVEERLRERALGQLLDFADAHGKRLLLVVENFNMLLADQFTDDDAWVLRHTLANESRIMILASAPARFDETENTGKAMFELFKQHVLHPLDTEECRAIWESVSGEEIDARRIRPIQILTGGNPRLLTIIAQFGARKSFQDLMADLLHLVDEHTEYFKSHLDSLPPVERKVYVALAEIWDPATARHVADEARLNVNKVSSLLRRLVDRGAVTASVLGGKRRYEVAERLGCIYCLMRRRGRDTPRIARLVQFLEGYYADRPRHGDVEAVAEATEFYATKRDAAPLSQDGAAAEVERQVQRAALGEAKACLEELEAKSAFAAFEPLAVALRAYGGEQVVVAAEVREVADDIVRDIKDLKDRTTGNR